MRGPPAVRIGTGASYPPMNDCLWRPQAVTEPGLAAARRAARARANAGSPVIERYSWGSGRGRDTGETLARAEKLGAGSGDHGVLFHRGGDEFTAPVSAYLLEALRDGGAAIVIATPEHRRAIRDRLAQAGTDVAAAEAAGAFTALDAQQTMRRFMISGWPNAASFWQVISPLIRPATETFKPVRVFGELVTLLWDSSQVNAAIEVEAMWNELAAQYPFSLLCAYPVQSVSGEHHQDSLAEVCRIHSSVAGRVPAQA